MSDLRAQLDRVANRAPPQPPDPFERLTRRRRIRHRSRRITAGVLAIAVAVGGSIAIFKAFEKNAIDRPLPRFAGAGVDPALVFNVAPRTQISIGDIASLHVHLPQGSSVEAGAILRACGVESPITSYAVPSSGTIRFTIPGPTCQGIVLYPVSGWLVAYTPPRGERPSPRAYTRRILMDLRSSKVISHLTMVPVQFVQATTNVRAGPHPRGAFQTCPDVSGTLAPASGVGARKIAMTFSRLWGAGHHRQAQRYLDPSASGLKDWAVAGRPSKMRPLASKSASHDGLVRYGCGRAVAKRSWEVTVGDGTSSASLDFTIYLVKRSGGWKVWGSY